MARSVINTDTDAATTSRPANGRTANIDRCDCHDRRHHNNGIPNWTILYSDCRPYPVAPANKVIALIPKGNAAREKITSTDQCKRRESFCKTALNMLAGTFTAKRACRAFQSKLFTWSVSMTPLVFTPRGSATSKGYPFAWDVIGHASINPTFSLYSFGESTSAGRSPACSLPRCGLNCTNTISPRAGTYAFTILLFRRKHRYHSHDATSPG